MRDTESEDPFQLIGTTIEGKYSVVSVVGDGGFGVVYRAVHKGFDEPVAIKCLKLPSKVALKDRDALLEQLRDEGRLLLRLSRASSGIVQALDIGAFTTAEGVWVPYLVLEWLEGETLAQYARSRIERGEGPLSIADIHKLLEPAARALATAHTQKVAHRDVKPQNIFLAQVGSARTTKVLDFGIAKVLSDHPTFTQALAATKMGPTAFTPRYGAPEQFNKKRGATGPWTDVFALALIVVELGSGRAALDGDDPTELYIASADPAVRPTLRSRGMKAPEPVERVLAKALSVEPKHRYTDAGEFWDALSAAVFDAGASASQVAVVERAELGASPAQTMLSTEEFAAARDLDVSTDPGGGARGSTEPAPRVASTLPMTNRPEEAPARALDPTVKGAPIDSGDAKTLEKPAASAVASAGNAGPLSMADTVAAPSTDPTADAKTEPKADPKTESKTASKAGPIRERDIDPMSETPLPERAPSVVSADKKPPAPPTDAAAPAKKGANDTTKKSARPPSSSEPAKAPMAAIAAGGKPPWAIIGGGAAILAIGAGVLLATGGGGDKSGKPAASADRPSASGSAAASAKAIASAKPITTIAPSASASAAPANITPPDDMVYIPPGTGSAKLGDGDVAREVTLTKGFFLDRNEVTVHAYQACMARRMCSAADHVSIPADQEDAGASDLSLSSSKEFAETWSSHCNEPRKALDNPINCVDYSNAESFCRWKGKRLPTEAEWERAARGLDGREYAWGEGAPTCDRACFDRNGDCLARGGEGVNTCAAGGRTGDKTPEGAFDLGGNVSEWVSDGFASKAPSGADPKGDPASPLRVIRGGNLLDAADRLRASSRAGLMPGTAHVSIGFRCAADLTYKPSADAAAPSTTTSAAPRASASASANPKTPPARGK